MKPALVCGDKWSSDFKQRQCCVMFFFSPSISIFDCLTVPQSAFVFCTHRWSGLGFSLFIHPTPSVTCLLFRSLPWQGNKGKSERHAHDSELINPGGKWAKSLFFFLSLLLLLLLKESREHIQPRFWLSVSSQHIPDICFETDNFNKLFFFFLFFFLKVSVAFKMFFLFPAQFYYLLNFELPLLLHNDKLSKKNKQVNTEADKRRRGSRSFAYWCLCLVYVFVWDSQ